MSNLSEQSSDEYWEQVQEVGQLWLGEATTVKFQRGITKKDRCEAVSIRALIGGGTDGGPGSEVLELDVKTTEELCGLLRKALGKATQYGW